MTDRAGDQLVADYLGRLEAALASAPPDRRRELVEEIGAHVEAARAALPGGGDELAVRELLDRIGEPGEIAAAALAEDGDETTASGATASGVPAAGADAPGVTAAGVHACVPAPRPGWREGLAVPLLLFGGVLLPFFGWFPGVALLWWSRVWSTRDKVLGTFALPFGLLAPFSMSLGAGESCEAWSDGSGRVVEQCTGGGAADPVTIVFFALLVLIPLLTAAHLLLRLRTRRPAGPTQGVARSAPA